MKDKDIIMIKKIAENNQGQIRALGSALSQLNNLTAALFEVLKLMPDYDHALADLKEKEKK
jgi:hypothetical protein